MGELEPRVGLRRLRVQAGLSQEDVAEALQVAPCSYSDWERGAATPRPGRRPLLASILGVSDRELASVLDGEDLNDDLGVPGWLGFLANFESMARAIRTFEMFNVPGLLQTEGYALAVERSVTDEPVTERDIEQRVVSRLRRQSVLQREPEALELSVVLDESVLLRPAGDAAVMRKQIVHLLDMAQRPSIELRLLPLRAQAFAAFGRFTLFFDSDPTPTVASIVDRGGPHYLFRLPDLQAHDRLFNYLATKALTPAETTDKMTAICKEYYP